MRNMHFRARLDIILMRLLATVLCARQLSVQEFSLRVRRFTSLSSSANICFQLLLFVTMGDLSDMTLRQFVETVSACNQ